jgi:hypothetical protein
MIFPVGLLAVFAAISYEAATGASRNLAATAAQATKGLVARSLLGCRCHTFYMKKSAQREERVKLFFCILGILFSDVLNQVVVIFFCAPRPSMP